MIHETMFSMAIFVANCLNYYVTKNTVSVRTLKLNCFGFEEKVMTYFNVWKQWGKHRSMVKNFGILCVFWVILKLMFEHKKCDSKVIRKNITELITDKIVAIYQVFLTCANLMDLKLIALLHSLFTAGSQAGKQKQKSNYYCSSVYDRHY